ncbi:MAG: helix-turn-helix domain-containing protein [Terriglobales bacterium]
MASFGVRLKQEREQRGITLEEISSSTKIGTRMLVALEQDHFDQLPGGIFNKGFVRAYARVLGIDEDQAITDYLVASGNLPSEKEKDKKSDGVSDVSSFELQAEAEPNQSNLPWGTFAILLLLVALAFAAWGFYSREARKYTRKTTSPTPSSTTISPPTSPNLVPTTPAPTTPVPATPVRAISQPAPLAAVPRPLTLHLLLHADSWLSVTADGREILQGSSFGALTEKTVHATREIVVKAGNVGAIDFEFNGKKLPAQGADGEVKTLTFDATGLRPPAPPTEPPTQQP